MSRSVSGVALTLSSAIAFGGVAILAQLAYRADVSVLGLMSDRFLPAVAVLWLAVVVCRRPLPDRRSLCRALGLGVLYGVHALLLAVAFSRLDAGVASLLFFVNPLVILAGGVALGVERLTVRPLAALALAGTGLCLTLLAAQGGGSLDALGAIAALAAAVVYATFALGSSSLLRSVDPLMLLALTITGAAASAGVVGLAEGNAVPSGGVAGVAIVLGLGLVGTVLAPAALLGGVARLGPSRASIVGSTEPVFAALMGLLAFGDRITPLQAVGAALVLSAIPILELRTVS